MTGDGWVAKWVVEGEKQKLGDGPSSGFHFSGRKGSHVTTRVLFPGTLSSCPAQVHPGYFSRILLGWKP